LLDQAEAAFVALAMTWHLGKARQLRRQFDCG
jgi:hypothetical protein